MADAPVLAALFGLVLVINLVPAFGPPTWSVIVLFGFNSDLPLAPTVVVGAAAAALGRFLLATSFRALGNRLSPKIRGNLNALCQLFERKKRNGIIALGLFALSPLPSAQLFEAAGLARIRLAPFTIAFFAGRLVSYTIYAGTAHELHHTSIGKTLTGGVSSLASISIQLAMIAALVILTRIDWKSYLERTRDTDGPSSP